MPPVFSVGQIQDAAVLHELDRVLHQRQPVLAEAERLKLLVVRLLQARLLLHVCSARLEELREDDGAPHRAGDRDVLVVRAVAPALVTACSLDVGQEALVSVLVAERALPADARRPRSVAGAVDRALHHAPLTHMPGG